MFQTAIATAGTLLVVLVWLSVLRTTLIPREVSSRMARWTVRLCVAIGTVLARRLPRRAREWVMEFCVPASLFLLVAGWLSGVLLGFVLIASAVAGPADPDVSIPFYPFDENGLTRLLAMVAVISAASVLCVFGAYLVQYGDAYRRRERIVIRSATRMRSVTDAETLLAEHLSTGSRDSLDSSFAAWANWFADTRYSHARFPGLVHHRSAGQLCWSTAALIILDAAALVEAVAPGWAPMHARVLLDSGSACLQRLAEQTGAAPPPTTVSLHGREERAFSDTMRLAVDAGLPAEFDLDEAYREFQRTRVRYAPYAVLIASGLLSSCNDEEDRR